MHVGLDVEIHVLSFVARNTLPISGRVTKVSADALIDPHDRRARSTRSRSPSIESTMRPQDREVLISGMPVEVFIFTGSRTFLEYLIHADRVVIPAEFPRQLDACAAGLVLTAGSTASSSRRKGRRLDRGSDRFVEHDEER